MLMQGHNFINYMPFSMPPRLSSADILNVAPCMLPGNYIAVDDLPVLTVKEQHRINVRERGRLPENKLRAKMRINAKKSPAPTITHQIPKIKIQTDIHPLKRELKTPVINKKPKQTLEEFRQNQREYQSKPEFKQKRREYISKPETKQKRREYTQKYRNKLKTKALQSRTLRPKINPTNRQFINTRAEEIKLLLAEYDNALDREINDLELRLLEIKNMRK